MKTIILDSKELTMFSPESESDLAGLIPLLVPAYKQVFGDEIWKEGWKCTICKKSFAFNDPRCANGECCGQSLGEFYPNQEVAEMLATLVVKRYQLRTVLTKKDEVAGFQWGWVDSLDSINEKLELFPELLSRLRGELQTRGLYQSQMYYWSESGVLPQYRRRGLAKSMYADVAAALIPQSVRSKLLRTSPQSPQFKLSQSQGDQLVFNYTDNTRDSRIDDDRVILAGIL